MKKILILVNHDVVIYNFRKELVKELLKKKYRVYISSPYGQKIKPLIDMGCEYVETSIERHGTNVFKDLKLLLQYRSMIKSIKPDIVLSYTIKPNIYGSLACKLLNVPYISTITGLGTAFERKGIMQKVLIRLYKIAFKDIKALFFQNKVNMQFFIQNNIANHAHILVPGSGVNLQEYSYEEYPKESENTKLLFIGRIMKDKGIEELNETAKILKRNNIKVDFEAVGFYEDNYASKASELEASNLIKFHGPTDNVKKYIKKCNAVILPSYHEGMANVLLEAASMGRPVLASSIPGCAETFEEGITGFGFEPKNVDKLVSTICKFNDLAYENKEKMGKLGRKKMELEFDRNEVVSAYIDQIEKNIN